MGFAGDGPWGVLGFGGVVSCGRMKRGGGLALVVWSGGRDGSSSGVVVDGFKGERIGQKESHLVLISGVFIALLL